MKIIVISDTHGLYRNLETIVTRQNDADMFIHLGDGEREYRLLLENRPELENRFHYVRGNCDMGDHPISECIDVMAGHRIFATHGHRYQVRSSLDVLAQYAREDGCDIALYGHTHISQSVYYNGVYILNPGSASCPRDGNPPSYGVVDVSHAGVMTNVVFF
ncbi:MAG: metallophosphoesterase [Ruminococcus sp.]|nr:metallophosphoesterase [Ruminococcus sp.]MCD7959069.1 metallophosphoesterase [Ruminococcus sp.]